MQLFERKPGGEAWLVPTSSSEGGNSNFFVTINNKQRIVSSEGFRGSGFKIPEASRQRQSPEVGNDKLALHNAQSTRNEFVEQYRALKANSSSPQQQQQSPPNNNNNRRGSSTNNNNNNSGNVNQNNNSTLGTSPRRGASAMPTLTASRRKSNSHNNAAASTSPTHSPPSGISRVGGGGGGGGGGGAGGNHHPPHSAPPATVSYFAPAGNHHPHHNNHHHHDQDQLAMLFPIATSSSTSNGGKSPEVAAVLKRRAMMMNPSGSTSNLLSSPVNNNASSSSSGFTQALREFHGLPPKNVAASPVYCIHDDDQAFLSGKQLTASQRRRAEKSPGRKFTGGGGVSERKRGNNNNDTETGAGTSLHHKLYNQRKQPVSREGAIHGSDIEASEDEDEEDEKETVAQTAAADEEAAGESKRKGGGFLSPTRMRQRSSRKKKIADEEIFIKGKKEAAFVQAAEDATEKAMQFTDMAAFYSKQTTKASEQLPNHEARMRRLSKQRAVEQNCNCKTCGRPMVVDSATAQTKAPNTKKVRNRSATRSRPTLASQLKELVAKEKSVYLEGLDQKLVKVPAIPDLRHMWVAHVAPDEFSEEYRKYSAKALRIVVGRVPGAVRTHPLIPSTPGTASSTQNLSSTEPHSATATPISNNHIGSLMMGDGGNNMMNDNSEMGSTSRPMTAVSPLPPRTPGSSQQSSRRVTSAEIFAAAREIASSEKQLRRQQQQQDEEKSFESFPTTNSNMVHNNSAAAMDSFFSASGNHEISTSISEDEFGRQQSPPPRWKSPLRASFNRNDEKRSAGVDAYNSNSDNEDDQPLVIPCPGCGRMDPPLWTMFDNTQHQNIHQILHQLPPEQQARFLQQLQQQQQQHRDHQASPQSSTLLNTRLSAASSRMISSSGGDISTFKGETPPSVRKAGQHPRRRQDVPSEIQQWKQRTRENFLMSHLAEKPGKDGRYPDPRLESDDENEDEENGDDAAYRPLMPSWAAKRAAAAAEEKKKLKTSATSSALNGNPGAARTAHNGMMMMMVRAGDITNKVQQLRASGMRSVSAMS